MNQYERKKHEGYTIEWSTVLEQFVCINPNSDVETTTSSTMEAAVALVESFVTRDNIRSSKLKKKKEAEDRLTRNAQMTKSIEEKLDMTDDMLRVFFYKAYGASLINFDRTELSFPTGRLVCKLADLGIKDSDYAYAIGRETLGEWGTYNIVMNANPKDIHDIDTIGGVVMPMDMYSRLVKVLHGEVSFTYQEKALNDRKASVLFAAMEDVK